MHELNNSLCNWFTDVYFKDVSTPLELICYLGPHVNWVVYAWYIKENEIKQARKKKKKKKITTKNKKQQQNN